MTRMTALAAAALVAAACGGDRRDAPVATTTDRGTTTSPAGAASEENNATQVRLVSALPAAQNVDLATGDRVVFSGVPYKTVTPFRDLEGNVERFTLRSAGATADGEEVLADNREAMTDGSRYTVVALPDDQGKGAQLRVLKDDELVTDPGKAKIRVIHAAPNVGQVDVALSGQQDLLFDDVDFGKEAGFKEIDPTSGTLEIRRDDDDRDAKGAARASAGRMQLEAGRAYTVVIAGANPKRPEFITFVDEPMGGAATGGDTDTGAAGSTAGGRASARGTRPMDHATTRDRDLPDTASGTRAAAGGGTTRDTTGAMGGQGESGRTSAAARTGAPTTDADAPTSTRQKAGTMDRDRAGSTDEGTPPTSGTGEQGAGTSREPS